MLNVEDDSKNLNFRRFSLQLNFWSMVVHVPWTKKHIIFCLGLVFIIYMSVCMCV